MKQTAVEWLGNELSKYEIHNPISLSNWEILKQLLNQAKQIEKEQIMMSYHDGRLCIRPLEMSIEEQYYKQNFGE